MNGPVNPYINNVNVPWYHYNLGTTAATATSAMGTFLPGIVFNLWRINTNQHSSDNALPVFDDDDKAGDHENMTGNMEKAPRAAGSINPPHTLHSIYDYDTGNKTFPIIDKVSCISGIKSWKRNTLLGQLVQIFLHNMVAQKLGIML